MPTCATRCVTLGLIAALVAGVAGAGVNVWTPVGPAGTAWLQAFAVDPKAPDTLYAGFPGDRGIWKSRDGGEHWFECNTGISHGDRWIIGLAVHPTDSSIVFAANSNRKVFKSTDAGRTWRLSSDGMTPRGSSGGWFVFDAGDPDTMYVSWTSSG